MTNVEKVYMVKKATSLLTGLIANELAPEGEKLKRTAGAVLGDQIGGTGALLGVAPYIWHKTPEDMSKLQRFLRMGKSPIGIAALLGGSALGGLTGYYAV